MSGTAVKPQRGIWESASYMGVPGSESTLLLVGTVWSWGQQVTAGVSRNLPPTWKTIISFLGPDLGLAGGGIQQWMISVSLQSVSNQKDQNVLPITTTTQQPQPPTCVTHSPPSIARVSSTPSISTRAGMTHPQGHMHRAWAPAAVEGLLTFGYVTLWFCFVIRPYLSDTCHETFNKLAGG